MAKENWFWLAAGLGWAAVNTSELLAVYPGGPEEVEANLGSAKLDEILTQKQAERLAASRPADFALRVAHHETQGVHVVAYDDPHYPGALKRIQNPPLVLFAKGDLTLLNGQLAIGMIGARRPSAYGVEVAKALGRGIAMGGAIIISGMAAGLDTEAHKAALAVNGPTIACIAFGHDNCYPAANKKLKEVIERQGVVVSEYPLGTGAEKPYFLQRNRIIAGLSHGLVVVEARRHSGTMSTVNFATDFGRDVFAVPGSIFSELSGGTNEMIREGAYLAASAGEVLQVYGIEAPDEDLVDEAAKQQAQVGRPAPASAATPWLQGVARIPRPEMEEPLPGQQTMGEMLRQHLGNTGDAPVSAEQAIDAFRTLQRGMPPETDSELDARNAELDARIAAVSDSVELSPAAQKRQAGPARPNEKEAGPAPYPWHKVEHLDKSEIEKLSPAKVSKEAKPGKKPSLASRLFGGGQAAAKQADAPPQTQATPPVATPPSTQRIGAVERVGAVERIEPVARVEQVRAIQEAAPVTTTLGAQEKPKKEPKPAPTPEPTPVPRPVAEKPAEKPKADDSLTSRLKTIPSAPPKPEKKAAKPKEPPAKKDTAAVAKEILPPEELLSDLAKRALETLGPRPTSLDDICEKSGLSSAEAMAALTELELAGLSRQLAGRQFVVV